MRNGFPRLVVVSIGSLLAWLPSQAVSAHPGHGTTVIEEPLHYLVEPIHAPLMLAAVACVVALGLTWRALRPVKRQSQPQAVRPGSQPKGSTKENRR
jgi:hypothetical protein